MNLLDIAVLATVAIGGFIGFRVGFVIRALSWLGLSIGVIIGLRLMPRIARTLSDSTPTVRLLAASALLIGLALIGHTAGLVASQSLRSKLSLTSEASRLDRLTGGVLGALGGLVMLWLLVPAMRSTPGWPAQSARDSAMVALVERYAPAPPRSARILGRIIGEAPYPIVRDSTAVGTPPNGDAGPLVNTRTARSVVRVDGTACGLHLAGTGFAVAPDLIITNAHVVAGERRTTVTTVDGQELTADVVKFDGRHDVAVLHVAGAGLSPLPLGPTRIGTIGSVLGHPGGGPLRATPARIARRISTLRTDIYRSATITTTIVGLAAHLIVGDSGAPVVGPDGRVQAMVFAIDPASDTTGFALSSAEFRPFIAADRHPRPASTGTCLNDERSGR